MVAPGRLDRRLALVVAEGEGQRVELKRGLSDLAAALVGFANASGGSIFLGLDDHGRPAGLAVTNRLQSEVQDIAANCDPPVSIRLVPHGDVVLEVVVAEGNDKPYRCKDGFFVRNGPNTQKLRRNEIRELIVGAGTFHFDEQWNRDFSFRRDFDGRRWRRFLELCGIEVRGNADAMLANLDLASRQGRELLLNNAAVLFFAKQPQRFLRESTCTAARYQGTDRFGVIDRREIGGDPITIIEEALQFVQRNMAVKTVVTGAARHTEVYDYPLVAVREAIINAVAHRDYHYDVSHIYLNMFADRLEVESPGGLPHGIALSDLGQRSVRRNRAIADLLFRAKFIERIGSGIDRIRHTLAENNNPPFEVTSSNFFVIRFRPRVASSEQLTLSDRQLRLYRLVAERRSVSKREAAQWLEVSGDTALRELSVLVRQGLVRQNGVGKATKYLA